VYIHRPFIHVFLFEQRTPSLSITAFYRELHKHLRPLYKSLLNSTSGQKVAERIAAAAAQTSASEASSLNTFNPAYAPSANNPVYDLVYDPVNLSCHTSLPNIPDPSHAYPLTSTSHWTRLEALNVHSHILFTLHHSSRNTQETERTSKTSRLWWIVWLRIPQPGDDISTPKFSRVDNCRVAFLVRRARDGVKQERRGKKGMVGRVSSGMYNLVGVRGGGDAGGGSGYGYGFFGGGGGESDAQGSAGAGALAGGIGVDARKYVENLLSLNR
jgi:hypothetical protein